MLASSAYKGGDSVGYRGALARLVASHPKADYWRDLLAATGSASGFAPRLALDLDRLEAATGTLDTAAQYVQAAELALEQGLPGDAKAFLGQGYAAGVLGQGADAARHQRLLDLATRQALADAKSFPALAQEAAAAASGVPWQKLAEARASLGQYDEAITAFERALQKGGLKFPDDAKLHLGIACLRAGQAARAKEVLTSVSGNDGTAELARLWLIRGSGA